MYTDLRAYMRNRLDTHGSSIISASEILVPVLIAAILIIAVFFNFKEENKKSILEKNKSYIQEFTLSIASTLDQKFHDAKIAVEAIAGSIDYASLNTPGEAEKLLKVLEQETQFDHVRYVDTSGISHTSDGHSKSVAFRSYFTEGMKGLSGTTFITDSVLTNNRQIGFFAPIIRDGMVRGEIVVFYDEPHLAQSLTYCFYGKKASVAIINKAGEVLVNSPSPDLQQLYRQGLPENFSEQTESALLDEATKASILNALKNHAGAGFELEMKGSATVGYMAPLASEGLSVCMVFPYKAHKMLYEDSISAGRNLQAELVLIFGCFAGYLAYIFIRRLNREKKKNRLAVAIAVADKKLSKGHLVIDLKNDRVENLSDLPLPEGPDGMNSLEKALLRFSVDSNGNEDIRSFMRQIGCCGNSDAFPVLDIELHDDEGKICYYNFAYIPVEEKSGKAATGVIQVLDVTARKNRELENNRILRNALKEAEAANAAKSLFLNNMSHDIRTPMNAILGFSNLMESVKDDPVAVKKYLDKIRFSGLYLLDIINNVLDMARIESGRVTLEMQAVDFMDEKNNIAAVLEEEIKKKNISFTFNRDFRHRYVRIDPGKINRIVINLLSNAVKYTPEGGSIHMEFNELPCEKPGHASFVLIVSDTGIGMSPEFIEHLFESFSRERNSTESRIAGTGLGMSIVKRLIDLMGGRIEVDSEPGRGSTFRVFLTHEIADPSELPNTLTPPRTDFGIEGKHFLLAEDNDLNAEIASAILEEAGASVERAADGAECVEMLMKAEPGRYDAVIMDIQMPRMNGYDATARIRTLGDPARNGIPILAMTANVFEEDRSEAFRAGMDGHVAKPINVTELMKELARVLRQQQGT